MNQTHKQPNNGTLNAIGIEGIAKEVNAALYHEHHILEPEETQAVIRNFGNEVAHQLKYNRIVFIEGFGSFEMKDGEAVFFPHSNFLKRLGGYKKV